LECKIEVPILDNLSISASMIWESRGETGSMCAKIRIRNDAKKPKKILLK
jgi:hypothetical protein